MWNADIYMNINVDLSNFNNPTLKLLVPSKKLFKLSREWQEEKGTWISMNRYLKRLNN